MSDSITESQGKQIIKLLGEIVNKLDSIKSNTEWINEIDNKVAELNTTLEGVNRAVNSINSSD